MLYWNWLLNHRAQPLQALITLARCSVEGLRAGCRLQRAHWRNRVTPARLLLLFFPNLICTRMNVLAGVTDRMISLMRKISLSYVFRLPCSSNCPVVIYLLCIFHGRECWWRYFNASYTLLRYHRYRYNCFLVTHCNKSDTRQPRHFDFRCLSALMFRPISPERVVEFWWGLYGVMTVISWWTRQGHGKVKCLTVSFQ